MFVDMVTKEFHVGLTEDAFFAVNHQAICVKDFENLSEILQMFFQRL